MSDENRKKKVGHRSDAVSPDIVAPRQQVVNRQRSSKNLLQRKSPDFIYNVGDLVTAIILIDNDQRRINCAVMKVYENSPNPNLYDLLVLNSNDYQIAIPPYLNKMSGEDIKFTNKKKKRKKKKLR